MSSPAAWCLILAWVGAACGIRDPNLICGDLECPHGTVCTSSGCANADQVAACDGATDATPCTTLTITDGACVAGVCQPSICGDGALVGAEVCDDSNQRSGDGCSADCRSLEICGNGYLDGVSGEQCDNGVVGLSRDGCTSLCTIEFDAWTDVTQTRPPRRTNAAIAYDARRQRTVMFGGYVQGAVDETWDYDGQVWRQLAPITSPPPRSGHVLVYDAQRERVVMFGGEDDNGELGDTWEWDGLTWTELHPPTSPAARRNATATYDSVHHVIVLFGGRTDNSALQNETWTFDGTTWTELHPASPPPASPASMACDGTRTLMLVADTPGNPLQTWAWDGAAWSQLAPATVPPTLGEMTSTAGSVYELGTYATTGYTWTGVDWATATAPTAGQPSLLAYDSTRSVVVITTEVLAVPTLWECSTSSCAQQTMLPPALYNDGAQVAYLPLVGKLVHYSDQRDLWEWDGVAWEKHVTATVPQTSGHAIVATRDQMLLYSGHNSMTNTQVSETWLWSGVMWTKLAPATQPTPRTGEMLAYDTQRDRVVMFGGGPGSDATYTAETWEWDGTTWLLRTPMHAPSARSYGALAYDPIRGRTVLFSGDDSAPGESDVVDTWEWDGTDWTQLSPALSPPPRDSPGAAFDPARGSVVIFGGQRPDQPQANDTWEWDGTTWRRLEPVVVPPGRMGPVVGFDAAHEELVMAGGYGSFTFYADTWVHRFSSQAVPIDRCEGSDTDGDGLAGCADPDCWGRCTPLCPPRTTCDPAAPRCGDGLCSPIEDRLLCPSDCGG